MTTMDDRGAGARDIFAAATHHFIDTNGLRMHIVEQGTGPLALLCHGFPECWYTWRHQLAALAVAGYRAVAPDQRGYGQTTRPDAPEAYTLLHLVGDVVGLLDALGEERTVVVGHDWGATVAWHAALLRPDRVRAVVALSVPYVPHGPVSGPRASGPPTAAMRRAYGDAFYQLYFQEPGVAEAELGRDVRATLRRLLYSLSGDAAPGERWQPVLPGPGAGLLAATVDPAALPPWLSEADLDVYAAAFADSGFGGGLNWYRNVDRNGELLAAYSGAPISQPALFLRGDRDPTLDDPGVPKRLARQAEVVPRLREVILAGCGHWVAEERAAEVSTAILGFLAEL